MRRRLTDNDSETLFSPLIDVIFNAMAAMLIILFVYMMLFNESDPHPEPLRFLDVQPTAAAWNLPYAYAFPVAGGVGSRHFSIISGVLPPSLHLIETHGLIIGTPRPPDAGRRSTTVALRVAVTDSVRADTVDCTLEIRPSAIPFDASQAPLKISRTDSLLPPARVGTDFEEVIGSIGGLEPQDWEVVSGRLPPGVNLEGGLLHGRPSVPGQYRFEVRSAYGSGSYGVSRTDTVRWSAGAANRAYTLTVMNRLEHAPAFPPARAGQSYEGFVAVRNLRSGEQIEIEGDLPGCSADPAGVVRGVPTAAGTFNLRYRITDGSKNVGEGRFAVEVLPPLPEARVGGAWFQCWAGEQVDLRIPYVGLSEPVRVEIDSDLPDGLRLVDGELTGIPTEPALVVLRVRASDSRDVKVNGTVGLRIGNRREAVTITSPDIVWVRVNSPFEWRASAAHGEGAYEWKHEGSLPAGIRFDNGFMSGVIADKGDYPIAFRVTDQITGDIDSGSIILKAIEVDSSTLSIVTTSIPAAVVRQPYHVTFAAQGGVGRYHWEFKSRRPLPKGMSFTEDGLSGIPEEPGVADVQVTVVDDVNQSAGPESITLLVADPAEPLRDSLSSMRDSLSGLDRKVHEMAEAAKAREAAEADTTSSAETTARPTSLTVLFALIGILCIIAAVLGLALLRARRALTISRREQESDQSDSR